MPFCPAVEDDDNYAGKNRLWDWLERRASGRKLLAARHFLLEAWHRHVERYHLWDETLYKVCTWLVVIVLALLAVGAGDLTLKVYRRHAEKSAQAMATAFLARGDTRNAILSATRALAFNPNNVGACRVMAAIADQSNSVATLEWLGRVAHIEPTLENKLRLVSAGMRYQPPPYPYATYLLQTLAPTATNTALYQVAAASLAMNLQRYSEAKDHFAAAAALDPTNEQLRISVALYQLLSTNQAEQASAWMLLDRVRTNETVGVFALRGLVEYRLVHGDLAGAEAYGRELAARPRATLADRLNHLQVLHQLKSDRFPAELQVIEAQARTNEPALLQLAAWARDHGLVAENLQWMMTLPNDMLDRPQIQMSRAQGYLQSSNWVRLREVASHGDWGDQEFVRFALVSRACSELNETALADSNWSAAMKDASARVGDCAQLLAMAEGWGLKHEREQLLLMMAGDFPDLRWAAKLEQIYHDAGNTLGLHQLYGNLFFHYPDSPVCKSDLANTEMLLKLNLQEACARSGEAFRQNPTNAIVAMTYAYGLHLQNRDLQGLDAFKNLRPEQLEDPEVALYHGVLLASAGRSEEAKTWLQLARRKGNFLPEERQLLEAALAEVAKAS